METSKEGIKFTIVQTHIADIKAGDTILHDDHLKTVCACNIKHDSFLGASLFGNSYMAGRAMVSKANIFRALPPRA